MPPLVGSTTTSVLFVDPHDKHCSTLQDMQQHDVINALKLLASASIAADIQPHIVSEVPVLQFEEWPCNADAAVAYHLHWLRDTGPIWSASGLANALSAEQKPNLLLCGFWLETKVSFLALNALSAGYDVYLALDASPSCIPRTREAAFARLQQSGVVPTTTHQILAEWFEESTKPGLRAILHALLTPT
ncbi:MAG: isochorismatase family protein [Hyphomicrobiaceae bacterium]